MNIPKQIENLPITPYLAKICKTLKESESRFLVLTAETAAGKSTAVPFALLQEFEGKILMLEPRRLAVTAISERVSELMGEQTGGTVGYRLHLDSCTSSKTRLEVITEAILIRKLQSDPVLEDINIVIIDEFHERSVYADLSLAFLKEAMQVRDDLYVIVMSATIDYQSVANYLNAPVVKVPGRQYPVTIEYDDKSTVTKAVINQTVVYQQEIHNNVDKSESPYQMGSILVFLPGIKEITNVRSELEQRLDPAKFEIQVLHSSIPTKEQRALLIPPKPESPRRIILSSAIAETSITLPAVTTVIDSGLCRMNTMNTSLGMERLITTKESLFSADQRAGRAGRLAAGHCIRLWNKFDVRPEKNTPEILRTDLAQIVLECAKWGSTAIDNFSWLDEPPKSSWNAALQLLDLLGCIKDGKITDTGNAVLTLGLNPRLACTALKGAQEGYIDTAIDCVVQFSEYADASPNIQEKFRFSLKERLKPYLSHKTKTIQPNLTKAMLLLAGFPDRLAHRTITETETTEYQFVSGRKARIKQINAPEWIVAPEVDAGSTIGKIYSYEPIDLKFAESWAFEHSQIQVETNFLDKNSLKIIKTERRMLGAIELCNKKLTVTKDDFVPAVSDAVKKYGLDWLPLDEKTQQLLLRAEFFAIYKDNAMKEKLDDLQQSTTEWLSPFLTDLNLNGEIVYNALYWYLDGATLDKEVPVQIILPNEKKRKLVYEKHTEENGTVHIQPVLEIIIQQIFGCFETPKILGRPVLLKLLSPARRPLQITEDLGNFWNNTWLEICKEMKGRYPKHNWDYRLVEKD